MIVDASDVGRSAAFWQSVGFKPLGTDNGIVRLEFRSLLAGAGCEFYVREDRGLVKRRLLDAAGFNCIAFVSSDVERDRRKFDRLGLRTTDPNHFRVGGKDLAIFWLQGPGGEIVEIIGLAVC